MKFIPFGDSRRKGKAACIYKRCIEQSPVSHGNNYSMLGHIIYPHNPGEV